MLPNHHQPVSSQQSMIKPQSFNFSRDGNGYGNHDTEYESPSNLLKFSSKTSNHRNNNTGANRIGDENGGDTNNRRLGANTESTTMNSSRKLENSENDGADIPSMFLRTPNDKSVGGIID